MRLRVLGREFDERNARRLELDAAGVDDVSREEAYARWLGCANQIIALRASTRDNLRLKCRVLRSFIAATGDVDLIARAALSLADDIEPRSRHQWP
jgi:hypothetical protein